jgi:toxin ParE1/3/4
LALRQITRIFDYLHELNPRAATEVSASLIAAGNSLANFSHRGRPVPQTDLRELVTAYPYIIRYQITRDRVRIVRVRHTARRSTKP